MKLSDTNIFTKINRQLIGKEYKSSTDSVSESLKQTLFLGLSVFAIIVCGPLFIYGSLLFFNEGHTILGISELATFIVMIVLVANNKLTIGTRNFIIILSLYLFSVALLIFTGNTGAGMVGIVAIMFLSGLVLCLRRLITFLVTDVVVFTILTVIFMQGFLKGFQIQTYEGIWFINMLTAQFSGIGLMFLIHLVYNALDRQNKKLKTSENLLRQSEESKALLLSNIHGMVYRCKYDPNWTMKYISEGCYELTGYKAESLLNNKELSYADLIVDAYKKILWDDWTTALKLKRTYRGEYQIIDAQGNMMWVYEQGKGVYKQNGEIEAIEGIIIDITERKNKENRILYLNQYDVLTGLNNRRSFEEQKRKLFSSKNNPVSVIIGDINGLKLVNDTLGHDMGDKLIIGVAEIFKSSCRKQDFIARTGGDEFIIIQPKSDSTQAQKTVAEIQEKCQQKNIITPEKNFYFSLSLGFATKKSEDDTIEQVLKIAENYMYQRKLLSNKSVHNAIIKSIQATMYERSFETEEHSRRLAYYAGKIGRRLNLPQGQLDEIELLAMLHDIGKIGVDDNVLKKPGPLTDTEWIQMKRHPEIGYRIAISSPELSPIAEYILSHHERWDGKGYPRELEGENIPIQARIIAVADAYDAMTNDRPYRDRLPEHHAIDEIKKNAGKQFDPKIVEVFLAVVGE
jgi:diguanylate cyclase (GGDEF)-like protein/PAS domain S-box-containing protein